MLSLVFLLCLAVIAAPLASGNSDKASTFFTFFNGELNNGAQNGTGHDYIEVRMVPLIAPELSEYPVVFVEEVGNGIIQVFQVGIFEDQPGNNYILRLYNFIDYANITPLNYDYTKVSNLQLEDLTTDDDCFAPFELQGPRLFIGTFPECKFTDENGKHPRFELAFDCQHDIAIFPTNINQQFTLTPYVLSPTGPRFPVPNTSPNFVSPCPEYIY